MHWARCLSRRTEKDKAYGPITAKFLAVLEALLWAFHNARSGLCFPSYKAIAEAAGCAASTDAEAIKALEAAGVLTWVNRLKKSASVAPISWAPTAGVGAYCGRATPTSSTTSEPPESPAILLNPIFRVEPRFKEKLFPLLRLPRSRKASAIELKRQFSGGPRLKPAPDRPEPPKTNARNARPRQRNEEARLRRAASFSEAAVPAETKRLGEGESAKFEPTWSNAGYFRTEFLREISLFLNGS